MTLEIYDEAGVSDFGIRRASSLLSTLAVDRRPRRTSEAISAMQKSWKPSPRDGSSLYRLVGNVISQERRLRQSDLRCNRSSCGVFSTRLRREGGALAGDGRQGSIIPSPGGRSRNDMRA